jgi:hypothetical protein
MGILGELNLRVQHGVIEVGANKTNKNNNQPSFWNWLKNFQNQTGVSHETTGIHHKWEQVSCTIETSITS